MTSAQLRLFAVSSLLALFTSCTTPQQREANFLKSGQQFLDKKDYARAALAYQNAAKLNPKNAGAYYGVGQAYLGSKEIARALGAFSKALEADPNHGPTQMKLAGMLSVSGREDMVAESAKQARNLLARSPGNVDALNILAFAESQLGRDGEAEKALRESLEGAPGNLNALLTLALLRIDSGDLGGAERILRTAVEKWPKSAVAWTALAQIATKLNKAADSEDALRRAVGLDPTFAPALLALASMELRSGQTEKAGETYARIAALPDGQWRTAHASFLLSHGRSAEGIRALDHLARAEPGERSYRSLLVAAYAEAGRIEDARKALGAALGANPKDAEALVQQAALDLREGHVERAAEPLTRVMGFAPEMAASHYLMAHVHRARGAEKLDRNELGVAIEKDPFFLAARLELAASRLDKRTARSALDILDAAPGRQKESLPVQVMRNWALVSLEDWGGVEKSTTALLARGSHPDVLIQSALARMHRSDFSGARPRIDAALREAPGDLRAVNTLLGWYTLQGRAGEGVGQVSAYAAAHANIAPLQTYLGELLLRNQRAAEARAAFETARRLDPGDSAARLNLARLDLLENQTGRARQTLEGLLVDRSSNVVARLLLAQADVSDRQYEEAVAAYREILKTDPENVTALNNAAAILSEHLDRPEEALPYASRAVELAPDDPNAQDTLGWVYYTKNLPAAALPHLEAAAAAKKTARNQYRLALLHRRLGNPKRSVEYLTAALKLDPKIAAEEPAQ
jgi:tetratricopeptide (TPR) repeat protein